MIGSAGAVAALRPRARGLVWPSLSVVLVVTVACYFAAQLPSPVQRWLIALGAAALIVILWVVPLVRWLSTRYLVMPDRIVVRAGLLRRVRTECSFDPGLSVRVERRLAQRLTGCGDLVVLRDGARVLTLDDVPSSKLLAEVVAEFIRGAPPRGEPPAR